MILRILIAVAVCILVIFLAFWLLTGGLSRGILNAKGMDNPLAFLTSTTSGIFIKLPWQPDVLLSTPDTTAYEEALYRDGSYSGYSDTPQQQLNDLQGKYDDIYSKANDAKTFGTPSPHRGKVTFSYGGAQESEPAKEYVQLNAGYSNTAPISMTGWSLQSAVTGVRVSIPQAAPAFLAGALNAVGPVIVNPGTSISIVTGISPVGISFRINSCSGYLAEMQTFTPNLPMTCPSPREELRIAPETIRAFGESCIDYVQSLRSCHFPGKDSTPNISPECKNFAVNTFSYNGCVYAHRNEGGFAKDEWRLYLTSSSELWRNSHDIIRLLDEQGRTVDVLTY